MRPYYSDDSVTLHHGDCLDVLRTLPDSSVDAVVTDPPYGLEFMGKDWDRFAGQVTDRDFKGFVLSQQRTRNVKCPECGKWAYDHPGRLCECGGVRRAQGSAFQRWCEQWAAECLRILKPGGHLLAFGGTRTVHRLTCAIEDAGFEIRDGIDWLYASGFPKSLDVSKAIDKIRDWTLVERLAGEIRRARAASGLSLAGIGQAMQAATDGQYGTWYHRGGHMFFETGRGLPSRPEWEHLRRVLPIAEEFAGVYDAAEREVLEVQRRYNEPSGIVKVGQGERTLTDRAITAPATEDAARWSGWGTALKPAREPIVMARKPLAGTVAANVLAYGTGALNIDACRVEGQPGESWNAGPGGGGFTPESYERGIGRVAPGQGRWPSNVVLSHAPDCGEQCVPGCPVAELDRQSGVLTSGLYEPHHKRNVPRLGNGGTYGDDPGKPRETPTYGDSGGASRFFPVFRYEAKAPTAERPRTPDGTAHPTVKPLDLMRWLVRLVTPPGGVVLEPFAGSGTTAEACVLEGFRCIAIEREAAYLPLITARLTKPLQPALDFGDAA